MLRALPLAVAFLLLTGCQTPIPGPDIEALSQSVVRIVRTDGGYGTGWILNDGRIATVAHGPKLGEVVSVHFRDREEISGTVIWANRRLDLAIVSTSVPPIYTAASLSCGSIRSGQSIIVIGHPLRMRWAVFFGYITAVNPAWKLGVEEVFAALQLPAANGMSGAPVFDDSGKVIGMALGWLGGRNDHTTGFAYMLRATAICEALP